MRRRTNQYSTIVPPDLTKNHKKVMKLIQAAVLGSAVVAADVGIGAGPMVRCLTCVSDNIIDKTKNPSFGHTFFPAHYIASVVLSFHLSSKKNSQIQIQKHA